MLMRGLNASARCSGVLKGSLVDSEYTPVACSAVHAGVMSNGPCGPTPPSHTGACHACRLQAAHNEYPPNWVWRYNTSTYVLVSLTSHIHMLTPLTAAC